MVISAHEIRTNAHVVNGCKEVTLRCSSVHSQANVIARDEANDLAVVHSDRSLPAAVSFRDAPVRPGDQVVALGYPLAGLLVSSVSLTVGNVSALAGLGDDSRFLQISAPVQPGNSGGPLLDASGHLVGIVSGMINDRLVVRATGSIPQNVNFALKTTVARTFLDSQGIAYQTAQSEQQLSPADVGAIGRPFTVNIRCYGGDVEAEASPPVDAPWQLPPMQPVRVLPACNSPRVTNTLIRIGLKNGIAVHSVYGRALSATADMEFCRALVSSNVGNRIVNYNVTWMNPEIGQVFVRVTRYSAPLLSSAPRVPLPRLPGFAWRQRW